MPPKQNNRSARKPRKPRAPGRTRTGAPRFRRSRGSAPMPGAQQAGRAIATRRVRANVGIGSRRMGGPVLGQAYATAIALPHESMIARFPSVDNSRTSVAAFLDQYTITTNTVAYGAWSPGDLLFAFFGQPNRLAMQLTTLPSAATSVYGLLFSNSGTVSSTWTTTVELGATTSGQVAQEAVATSWPIAGGSLTSGTALHGLTMPVGLSSGSRYIWVDAGTVLNVTTSFTGAASIPISYNFVWKYWSQENSSETGGFSNPNGTSTSFTAPSSGYLAIALKEVVASGPFANVAINVNITVTWTNTGPLATWSTIHLGDLDPANGGDVTMGRKIRINASSLLLTNTTATIQKQGTVLSARLNELPFYVATPATLARSAEKYTGGAENGVYTFKEFTPYSEVYRAAIDSGYLVFDLDYNDFYHFIQISSTSFVASPNTFTLSLANNIEFQSDLSRHVKGFANPGEYAALIHARGIIASTPEWFFENPSHLASVMGLVSRGAAAAYRGIKNYGPRMMSAASFAYPQYSPLFTAARGLMRALP